MVKATEKQVADAARTIPGAGETFLWDAINWGEWALAYGKIQEAAKGAARQVVTLNVGISDEKAREINKFIKAEGPKGVQSQVQGDQLRVTGKKRDDLQATIAALKGHDFDVPLQFVNFRD